jgi:putative ABC transport system substrate-binding protein
MWPLGTRGQNARAGRKIGFLHPESLNPVPGTLSVSRSVWLRLGYVEGETVLLRSAEGELSKLPELVAELIRQEIGVLIVVGPAAVRAAHSTSTVPIVAVDLETDPVRSGLVASLDRPGGHLTGLFMDQSSLAGKLISLLRDAVPQIERVALVWDPDSTPDQLQAAKAAASTLRIDALVLEVRRPEEFEGAFKGLGSERRTGVVLLGSPTFVSPPARTSFGDAALKYGLPAITFLKSSAEAGALMAYGPNAQRYYARAVILADKILKGEKSGDQPIERPDQFDLVINLRTAKALGLTIPATLLSLADALIE